MFVKNKIVGSSVEFFIRKGWGLFGIDFMNSLSDSAPVLGSLFNRHDRIPYLIAPYLNFLLLLESRHLNWNFKIIAKTENYY